MIQMANKHKLNISSYIRKIHENTVAYGPLKGLKFVEESHWGLADKGTMILGLYEQEVLQEISSIPSSYNVFIDLGAADGYYGVGVLVNNLFTKSYCYEVSESGRDVISKTAKFNGLSDRVIIRGEATKNIINEIPVTELQKSVLFVDIEGAEFDLFDEAFFLGFKDSIIFLELHEWFFMDGSLKLDKLISDSKKTHKSKRFKTGSRDLSNYPELEKLSDLDRWMICSEGRAQLMSWMRFDPCTKF